MPEFGYLVVEGPHDVELVYRLLSPRGFDRVRMEADLDPFWHPLIPRSFPPHGDLQKRVPVPLFLQSATHSVAVHAAIGDSRLVQSVEETAIAIDRTSLVGIGLLLDADSDIAPKARYEAVRDGLRSKGFPFPDASGEIGAARPRLGAFVLPDNENSGTLESVLLECAGAVYPTLLASATAHVDAAIVDPSLVREDARELRKPAGRNKAIIGSIASVLRPGRAVQVSLQDNRWLRDATLELPRVKAIRTFLVDLLGVP